MPREPSVFLEAAVALGDLLAREAVWKEAGCQWVGLTPVQVPGGYRHQQRPLGSDLYSGAAGNACFLSRLHRATGDRRIEAVALGAARRMLDDLPSFGDSTGVFDLDPTGAGMGE